MLLIHRIPIAIYALVFLTHEELVNTHLEECGIHQLFFRQYLYDSTKLYPIIFCVLKKNSNSVKEKPLLFIV